MTLIFNHLVGADDQRRRVRSSSALAALEVDDQLKFGWLLDRKVSRTCGVGESI
jgi:hypothetical protein